MNKRAVLALPLILLFLIFLVCVILISSQLSTQLPSRFGKPPLLPSPPPPTIYINDGANLTDMIQQNGNVYTLTRDIYNYTIRVSKNNVVIDGAGHTLQGTPESERGIDLDEHIDNVTIRNLQIAGFGTAIEVPMCSNITITANNITDTTGEPAINFYYSSDNNITGNRITANAKGGITEFYGSGNVVSDNFIADNKEYGIQLSSSSGTVLRNNRFENNTANIAGISENEEIDASNTVQGKPVCYWTSVADKTVPLDAGLVVLVSCNNITVKNLNLI
jgi:parallel beta-helix repeat protein